MHPQTFCFLSLFCHLGSLHQYLCNSEQLTFICVWLMPVTPSTLDQVAHVEIPWDAFHTFTSSTHVSSVSSSLPPGHSFRCDKTGLMKAHPSSGVPNTQLEFKSFVLKPWAVFINIPTNLYCLFSDMCSFWIDFLSLLIINILRVHLSRSLIWIQKLLGPRCTQVKSISIFWSQLMKLYMKTYWPVKLNFLDGWYLYGW